MPDLFYSTADSSADQLKLLQKDILDDARRMGINKKKLSVVFGDQEYVGNNVLLVQPPFSGRKYFDSQDFSHLLFILQEYEMYNYFITYAHLLPLERHTKDSIKAFGSWIAKLVDIIQPKLIVALGEEAQLSFLKKKCILRDYHGQRIGTHADIPIFLTYPTSYYLNESSYENKSYKDFILHSDWKILQKEYQRRIKCQ
jgi:hypothetical protein